MDKIEIGAVAKPQGIKGELKIKLFADDFNSVKGVKKLEIDGKEYEVESFRKASETESILKLKGVSDRNAAESFRMKSVYAERGEIIVPKGKFFIADVIGCTLFLDSGKEMGKIYDIVSGNVDYYYVSTQEGNAVFPLVKELNALIEPANKRVTVSAKRFTEVVLYED